MKYKKYYNMKETLEFLEDYAITSDNLWLLSKLNLLKDEIKIEILKAELQILKTKWITKKLQEKKPLKT